MLNYFFCPTPAKGMVIWRKFTVACAVYVLAAKNCPNGEHTFSVNFDLLEPRLCEEHEKVGGCAHRIFGETNRARIREKERKRGNCF